jgi:hypothetical protein
MSSTHVSVVYRGMVELMSDMVIGVDIGGSGVRAARWSAAAGLGPSAWRPLNLDLGAGQVLVSVIDVAKEARAGRESRLPVGVFFPAILDDQRRVCSCVNRLGMLLECRDQARFTLADTLRERPLVDVTSPACTRPKTMVMVRQI